ncbi:hypothetical protein QJ850_gp381 [Acanthamoeba polyphaga mimivirus]|uniref:Uncharacterized protein n=1 Tax=Acanthamoeba polyphaga mimivirus Kroon TaxID=3069720 RepID=A0A0G2Y3F7_9VIRU|nr:hypothetical protein QJ850_gp381 [Acanthamoeba polyphaga mimivirus]AKI80318.1 hypothetical protein [Acanthamoeba polyphaga mimivirus Kroon]
MSGFVFPTYSEVQSLQSTVSQLASNSGVKNKLANYGLNVFSVAWEDTSRYINSCVGSNISDVTLKVNKSRMPIIRSNNFTDVTVDVPVSKLPKLVVGNHDGIQLKTVSLEEYLKDFHLYCGEFTRDKYNLFADRDQHVLTSSQACVLPLNSGEVEFAVDLYNYQSRTEPAVLVIVSTAYGTSAQVVCGGNTELYFNDNSVSRMFKAERIEDFRKSQGRSTNGPMTTEEKALNGIYIYQVPLVYKQERPNYESCFLGFVNCNLSEECAVFSNNSGNFCESSVRNSRGMSRAILSLGQEKGPYKGIKKTDGGLYKLERDQTKPVRLTVQFYMCTDTINLSDNNVEEISNQIRRIYDQGLNEGSLVVDSVTTKPGLHQPTQKRPTQTTTKPYINDEVTML